MDPQDGAAQPITVVLVHGAFADASSWNEVVERLQAEGVQVTAPPNPLRGISLDSAYIAGYLDQIPGPVLAVGHSYGGAVFTNAATKASNVIGLVYVAVFAPDEGEKIGELTTRFPEAAGIHGMGMIPGLGKELSHCAERFDSLSPRQRSASRTEHRCT